MRLKKETFEFLVGERGATLDQFILSRETVANKEQLYISVVSGNHKTPIYRGDASRLRLPPEELGDVSFIGAKPDKKEGRKPKGVGGKRPYIMFMQDKGEYLNKLSLEATGFLMKLIGLGCVEWHTGRVIDKRSKKSLTIKRMCDKFSIKTTTLEEIMRELKASKIAYYDRSKKAYFVNRELFKKGGGLDEN